MLSFFKQMVLLMLREVGKFQKESSLLIWTLKDKSKHQANGRTFEMCGVGITKALERKQDEAEVSSVAQSCPTLRDPVNCSIPGLPVHNQLPEFTKTHVHRVSDAIQPSHSLSSPSPPAPNPSQHQSLFQ